jgi:ABC-type polysaccharide/polyol phosphate transport system ATPase subunit
VTAAGEVILEDAWRSFDIRGDRGRTLKELFTRRDAGALDRVQALAGVDLRVAPGETVGIVGRNGAGKTSTLRVLAGITPLDRGRAACGGRVATLIELGAGFGREFSGRENILLNAALHGLERAEIEGRMDEIVAFSELGHFVEAPVKAYSSGMLVRLGFSIAAHLDADVLLIDEVLAVGDEAFQRKCLRRISEHIAAGTTLVLVSHAPGAIERTCERVVVFDGGRIVFDGPTAEGLQEHHRRLGTEGPDPAATRPPGTEAVVVEDVELRDAADRRRAVFAPGEELRVALRIGARDGAGAFRVALELRREGGEVLFGTEEAFDRPGRITFTVPALHLLGGDYDLTVRVGGAERLVGLSVADTPGATGIADLRGTWSAERAAVAR